VVRPRGRDLADRRPDRRGVTDVRALAEACRLRRGSAAQRAGISRVEGRVRGDRAGPVRSQRSGPGGDGRRRLSWTWPASRPDGRRVGDPADVRPTGASGYHEVSAAVWATWPRTRRSRRVSRADGAGRPRHAGPGDRAGGRLGFRPDGRRCGRWYGRDAAEILRGPAGRAGILVDFPETDWRARAPLMLASRPGHGRRPEVYSIRCRPAGDLYLLKKVLNDWPDRDRSRSSGGARRLPTGCPGGRDGRRTAD